MSAYTDAVESGLDGLDFVSTGLCPGCEECAAAFGMDEKEFADALENGELCEEGGFSWRECEVCGSSLDGDRYAAHGRDANGEIVHMDVCADCLCYIANGDDPETWEG